MHLLGPENFELFLEEKKYALSSEILLGEEKLFLAIDLPSFYSKKHNNNFLEVKICDANTNEEICNLDTKKLVHFEKFKQFSFRYDISFLSGKKFKLKLTGLFDKESNLPLFLPRMTFITHSLEQILSKEIKLDKNIKSIKNFEIRSVIIGTSTSCNASCEHCPTNKPIEGVNTPGGVMSIELFKKIVNEIKNFKKVKGAFSMGLFNDSLTDPLLSKRIVYLRENLPKTRISVNTNFGLYDKKRHLEPLSLVDEICIQVSAFEKDLYELLMFPLTRERVFSRIKSFSKDVFLINNSLVISLQVPISNDNYNQVELIESFANKLECNTRVDLLPFSNRCGDNLIYGKKSLAPMPGNCRGDILDDLIIDYDGAMLSCCQDFRKRNEIGNLSRTSLEHIYTSDNWKQLRISLDNGNWNEIESCSNCWFDSSTPALNIERYKVSNNKCC